MVLGLAPDGGLFIPEELPRVTAEELEALRRMDYNGRAETIMGKFLEEFSPEELWEHVTAAYGPGFNEEGLTAPLHILDDKTAVLELFHGPTCAFKDMALQIMPGSWSPL